MTSDASNNSRILFRRFRPAQYDQFHEAFRHERLALARIEVASDIRKNADEVDQNFNMHVERVADVIDASQFCPAGCRRLPARHRGCVLFGCYRS